MKVKLEVRKTDAKLLEGTYTVTDANSFGKACADLWQRLEAIEFDRASSIGALMEQLGQNASEILDGAMISISRA